MAKKKPLGKRIAGNLGKKWIQVILSMVLFAGALALSHRYLVKQKATTEAQKKKDEAEFQFMHCDKCLKEMPYNKELANRPAMACKCKQGDAGFWEPTKESVAGGASPKAYFYTAILVLSLLWLAGLYYLLARKDAKPDFYYLKCLHCRDMLRYTANGFGSLVVCPSCALYLRLPDEEEALTMEDHEDDHTETVLSHFQARLIESGYQFPSEPVEGEGDGEVAAGADDQPAAESQAR